MGGPTDYFVTPNWLGLRLRLSWAVTKKKPYRSKVPKSGQRAFTWKFWIVLFVI